MLVFSVFSCCSYLFCFFFFNDTATTEIYTLSLHDALPISRVGRTDLHGDGRCIHHCHEKRSEEHTSELQSRQYLVCRLLLEKKKKQLNITKTTDVIILIVMRTEVMNNLPVREC